MRNISVSVRRCAVLVAMSLALTAGALLLPKSASAAAVDAESTIAALQSRNENLIVKYGLDEKDTGDGQKLAAMKWDPETKSYVADPTHDATIHYSLADKRSGVVASVEGVEGATALSFTGISYAETNFQLPQEADGMTISIWVKNLSGYFASLAEFWNGEVGGRLGKGTMQLSKGEPATWGSKSGTFEGNGNCPSYDKNKCEGRLHSFVVEIDNGDYYDKNNGQPVTDDLMVAEQWYQVTCVITEKEMRAYRDGELKQTFKKYNTASDNNVEAILSAIMTSAKSANGKLGIRLGNDPSKDGMADVLDDFRVYKNAMSQEEVTALYQEYKGIKALHGKTVKLEGFDSEYSVDNGSINCITVKSDSEDFPKILIGDVTAEKVTEQEGTYSATGDGFSYSYTVSDYVGKARTATVLFTEGEENFAFEVTHIKEKFLPLTTLGYKVNGSDTVVSVEGFDPQTTEYTVTLSPDVAEVELVAEVAEEAGETNVATVNESIQLNGDNKIVTKDTSGVECTTYTVTFQRARGDEATPKVGGLRMSFATQTEYVDTLPSNVYQENVVPQYPNGTTVESFSYDSANHVVTFTLKDKVTNDATEYSLTYKKREEAHIAHWSFDEVATENQVFKGSAWDTGSNGLKEDDSLNMTVRQTSGWGDTVVDNAKESQGTLVDGVAGQALKLGDWQYTTAKLPEAGGVTGFTFSTWMQTAGPVWEAIFAVNGNEWGTILEKGHMQRHTIRNGQPINGTDFDNLRTDTWNAKWEDPTYDATSAGEKADARRDLFNSTGEFVFYTVTATYVNGQGTVKFYQNGRLVATYANQEKLKGDNGDENSNKAKILIDALNQGASVGLHRHHYDCGYNATFDEANVFAYAKTDEEIKREYDAVCEMHSLVPASVHATGLGYPDLVFGGATVSGEGTKTGTTKSGITYSYTPKEGPATPEKDDEGVQVTLSTLYYKHTATVKFTRTLNLTASALGFKEGEDGENVELQVPDDPNEVIVAKVNSGVNLGDANAVTGGICTVKPLEGDDTAEHYAATFSYDTGTQTATVTLTYLLYAGQATVYHIRFVNKSTETFESLTVTEERGSHTTTLTLDDFDDDRTLKQRILVSDVGNFSVTVTLTLAEGAKYGTEGKTMFTVTNSICTEPGKYTFKVTNERGDEISYTLLFESDTRIKDATLKSLTVNGKELLDSAAIKSGTKNFTVEVGVGEADTAAAGIQAVVNVEKSTVDISYSAETKVAKITVTAPHGNQQVYTVTFQEKTKSGDATLSDIKVGGTSIEGFLPNKTEYTVKYKGDQPAVTATKNSSAAETPDITVNENVVTITVTAEDGTTKTYTVTLVKMGSAVTIEKLTINGTEVALSENKGSYSAPAGTRMDTLAVSVQATDENAAVKIVKAENKITVTVTSEDGEHTETYVVTVSFEASQSAFGQGVTEDNSPKQSGCFGAIGGMGTLALLATAAVVILACKKRKNG